ncbi:MAG TPA: glycosyltransferase family 39 protein [Thermoanaerobaculia bacterium]|nr:glycosyltransferase family 39 protein [Thermoanaerobaculia bacterium]HQR68147.1 glycosyltransferase family 39 protein [Thermoanaerobaculia bacterium]
MSRATRPRTPGAPRIRAGVAAAVLAVFAASLSAWISRHVFEGIPHISDAVSYAFQARVFASGHLFLPPPPVPEAFSVGNIVLTESRWAGKYPPGFPLLLSAGYLLGSPWLVNPLLLGLAVLGVYRLGRALYDAPTGLLAALLLSVSPFALLYGGTYLSHPSTLCVTIWTLDAIVRGRTSDRAVPLLLAGFLAGFAATIRPVTAAAVLVPAGVWLLWRTAPRAALRRAALLLAGAALPLALFAAFNAAVWGSPLLTGYAVHDPTEHLTGTSFHEYRSPVALLVEHLPRYLADLNRDPWAEPWPDLLPLLFLLPRGNRRTGDGLLVACALANVLAYSAYWSYDLLHSGPRYAFESLGPLALLVARGLLAGGALLRERLDRLRAPAALGAALLLAFAGLSLYFPLGRRLPELMELNSRAYGGQTLEALRRPGAEDVGPDALVLVSGPWVEVGYGAFFLLNDVDPATGRRVYALDLRLRRDELSAAFPRDQVWKLHVELLPWHREGRFARNVFEVRKVVWTRVR